MDFEIVWAEAASQDLEGIIRYLAPRSPTSAESLRTAILEHVGTLARFPFIGPVYERDESGRTREIMCRSYRIFYRVNEQTRQVRILFVQRGSRRDPDLSNGNAEA